MLTTGPQKYVGSFNFFSGTGDPNPTYAVTFVHSIDLDGDGLEEVVFSGFETQPNLPETYSNTQISIFGWVNGELTNITSSLLPDNINKVEGVGDVSFGDFNGDGRTDIFLSPYSDMNFAVMGHAYLSSEHGYIRQELFKTPFQHGSATADINRDGYWDVFATGYGNSPTIYFGSPDGLIRKFTNEFIGGSGVALGDFLGDGTVSVVLVDHVAAAGRDTALFRFTNLSGDYLGLEFVSALPTPRFDLPLHDLPEYTKGSDEWGHSHDIRAVSMDFDDDGLDDVLVISRPSFDGSKWPNYSEVQFLRNSGGGNFSDVTDTILKDYQINSAASYAPKLADFNGDGLTDIFLSEGSWDDPIYKSTTILIQQADGTFVDSYRNDLSALVGNNGAKAGIAQGPNGLYYLVSVSQAHSGVATVKVAPLYFDGRINGTDSADSLFGSTGHDYLSGWSGNDRLFGLDGNDTLEGGPGNDLIDGGNGIDTVSFQSAGSAVKVSLAKNIPPPIDTDNAAGVGSDKLKSIENIIAGNYDDFLIGSKVANSLVGGEGNDTIQGRLGSDTLAGGGGQDVFIFNKKPSASNIDTIVDFVSGEDTIQLSSIIFGKLSGTTVNLGFSAAAASRNQYLVYDIATGTLYYDADGIGVKPQLAIAEIGIGTSLHSTDIVII